MSATDEDEERDRCICGALVGPHWQSEPHDASARGLERGSCTACGLQLIRFEGERWRHIRG
jgi:hypothetical protein